MQDRLRALLDERKKLVDDGFQVAARKAAAANNGEEERNASSEMVERERARLEVLKRRQEKELTQVRHMMHNQCACCRGCN